MAYNHYLEEEDDKGYYHKNSLSYYYDEMERNQQLIEALAKKVDGYNLKQLDDLLKSEQLRERLSALWDEKNGNF